MEKNYKILILAVLLVVIAVALFALQPPSFEQEYHKMSLAWKAKGLGEHLHATDKLFSLTEPEIASIKTKIASFKSSTPNKAAASLANAYSLLLESALLHLKIEKFNKTLSLSTKSLCENLPAYKVLQEKLLKLKETRTEYINACNSFVSAYPKEAKSISLQKVTPTKNDSLEGLNKTIELAKEVCK